MKEDELRNILKSEMRQVTDAPLFTKKVLNNLPERDNAIQNRIFTVVYTICAVLIIYYWCILIKKGINDTGDAVMFCLLWIYTLGLTFATIQNKIKLILN